MGGRKGSRNLVHVSVRTNTTH
ncbi:hypothetical protein IEO21_10354 [Rhodonia placenta]|uniref:Uncharacterized protein n=1 Tax=Rhodonia placenta TaxID=104341 RepID=A0A8H7TXD5_9APHY|nr:hypothetical protein IEO21_10354 [Postia placenta]